MCKKYVCKCVFGNFGAFRAFLNFFWTTETYIVNVFETIVTSVHETLVCAYKNK